MGKCICGKTFKTYNGLRSHTYVCQITNNKTNEKNIRDIPSQAELWKMVSKLIVDNEKMKNEIKQLRTSILYQQRKIPIMELLKEKSFPQQTYTTWVDSIAITQEMLNIVFKDGQLKGVILALESCIECLNEREMFMRAFTHKRDMLYIYCKTGWEIMSPETIKQLWQLLIRKFIMQFNEWEKDPKIIKLIENDDTDVYLKNFNKTIGMRVNTLTAINKIRHALYEYLKCDPIKFVSF